jgi:hypothetical protein
MYMAYTCAISVVANKEERERIENFNGSMLKAARETFENPKRSQYFFTVSLFICYYGMYEFGTLPYNPYEAVPKLMKKGQNFIGALSIKIRERSGYGGDSERELASFHVKEPRNKPMDVDAQRKEVRHSDIRRDSSEVDQNSKKIHGDNAEKIRSSQTAF